MKLKSRPAKLPPYGFGFGIKRDIAASKRLDYVACNDWTNALMDNDVARADALRTRLISAWVRRERD